MIIRFEDIIQIIGLTSPKMKQICDAIDSDSPKSIRSRIRNNDVDFNEYYKYNDKIALMIEKTNDNNVFLHAYLLNENARPHTHYIFSTPNQNTAIILRRPSHNNSKYSGEVLKEKEEMENMPIANVRIYNTTTTGNIFNSNGRLIGEAKYSLVNVDGTHFVHLVYNTAKPEITQDGKKVNKLSTYYKVPNKLIQKMTTQKPYGEKLAEELLKEDGSDLPKDFTEKLLKGLDNLFKGLGKDDDNTDDNNLKK